MRREERPSLAGTWLISDGATRTIDNSNGYLRLIQNEIGYRMIQVSASSFHIPGLDFMIGFARGADGSFARILVSSNVDERWGTHNVTR